MQVFLSYRRGDTAGYAGRLYDGLVARLGADHVFQDISVIPPGQDFTVVLDMALDQSDAVLALIGPGWLESKTFDGHVRLQQDHDYVRLELAHALQRGLPVVPVLVGGATLPSPADLPEALHALANRQAVALHDETWHTDVDDLVRRLRGHAAPAAPTPSRRRVALAAAAAAVVLVAGATTWWLVAGRPDGASDADVTVLPTAPSEAAAPSSEALPAVVSCAPPRGDGWTALPLAADPTGGFDDGNGELVFAVEAGQWRPLQNGRWGVVLETSMENTTDEAAYHGDWHYQSLVVGQREFGPACFAPTPELVEADTVGDALIAFDVRCEPVGYMQLILGDAKDRIDVTEEAEPGAC